jgi:formate/nitrite transporter FocA (FNT family)
VPFLISLQSVAFWKLLLAFTAVYDTKMLVSGYQSIDMHYIVMPVKFDSGLFMLVLRNKQLFTKKKRVQKFTFSKSSNYNAYLNHSPGNL